MCSSETHILHSRYFTEDVVRPKIQVMPVLGHKEMYSHEQKTTYKQKSCWYCLQISIWTKDLDSQQIKVSLQLNIILPSASGMHTPASYRKEGVYQF